MCLLVDLFNTLDVSRTISFLALNTNWIKFTKIFLDIAPILFEDEDLFLDNHLSHRAVNKTVFCTCADE